MTWHPVESVIPKEHEQRALLMDQYGHVVIGVWQPAGALSTKGGPWLVEGEPTIAAGARFDRWQPFPKITTTKTINNLIAALEHEITKTIEVAVNDERNRCARSSKHHDRVNNLCARLSVRQNVYTKVDADLDEQIADLLRVLDVPGEQDIAQVIAAERERCAAIADSMDGVQNIGDRIRFGLGSNGPKENP